MVELLLNESSVCFKHIFFSKKKNKIKFLSF